VKIKHKAYMHGWNNYAVVAVIFYRLNQTSCLLYYVTITRMWYIITNNEIGQDAGAKLNLESSTNNEEGKERLREKE